MRIWSEVVGDIVKQLRSRRTAGAGASELVRFLEDEGIDAINGARYLKEAFLGYFPGLLFFLPQGGTPEQYYERLDDALGQFFEAAGEGWRSAPPYPDVMRRRDREAFRNVARHRKCHILVQAANPSAGAYVGVPGYRPAPPQLVACSRNEPPHAGLMSADPENPRLRQLLEAIDPPRTPAEHIMELRAAGYSVGDASEGYLIRDMNGDALYPGYIIEGVWSRETGANLWRPREGEALRRELNLRMGEELIARAPQGLWEYRNDPRQAGPTAGPNPPVLWFISDGNVSVCKDVTELRRQFDYYRLEWPYS